MILGKLRKWARVLKLDAIVLWLAVRDPRTPWHAKALTLFVAVYAFSPIDLIPDFVPILGWLDDVVIVPLGVWLVLRLIPRDLVEEFRQRAKELMRKPISRIARVAIALVLAVCVVWVVRWVAQAT